MVHDDLATRLGVRLRRQRLERGMTIGHVADESGVSRSAIGRMELGLGLDASLTSWLLVAEAAGLELIAEDVSERVWGATEIVGLASVGGWDLAPGAGGDRVLHLQRPPHLVRGPFKPRMTPGELAVVAVVDVLTDLDAAADRLARDVAAAVAPEGWVVSGCLVVRRTAGNQRRVTNAGTRAGGPFADSGSAWIAALRDREVRMPGRRSMVWMDARATRLIPTRLRLRRAA